VSSSHGTDARSHRNAPLLVSKHPRRRHAPPTSPKPRPTARGQTTAQAPAWVLGSAGAARESPAAGTAAPRAPGSCSSGMTPSKLGVPAALVFQRRTRRLGRPASRSGRRVFVARNRRSLAQERAASRKQAPATPPRTPDKSKAPPHGPGSNHGPSPGLGPGLGRRRPRIASRGHGHAEGAGVLLQWNDPVETGGARGAASPAIRVPLLRTSHFTLRTSNFTLPPPSPGTGPPSPRMSRGSTSAG